MTLSKREELFLKSLRELPKEAAQQVMQWTGQLSDLGRGRTVEWSDAWNEDDLQAATAASLRNFALREK